VKNKYWTPRNSDEVYDGYYSLPGALAKSIKYDCRTNNIRYRNRCCHPESKTNGIKGELPKEPSLALGTAEMTLLDLVSAYTTFLNKGYHRPPILITKIEDADGTVLEEYQPIPGTSVFSAETAGIMDR
jgi:penicillin-binding protein 1A